MAAAADLPSGSAPAAATVRQPMQSS